MSYGEANSYQGAPQHQQVSYQRPDVDESARYAAQHGGEDHGSLFSSILSNVVDHDDHKRPVEEHEVNQAADAHDRIYNRGDASGASSRDMGSAAALQAFKMFTSKGSGGGGGGGSSELIGMAMGEAMKLYKGSAGGAGGGGGGNQAEMLQAAAAMAMKLFASQSGGASSGGGSAGGIGALMGLLGKSGGNGGGHSSGGGAASLISKFL
ncbi:hypothetical protein BC941DRAFT_450788 [Chlamydoabsidia padenii]|nr:hypothetical protein BC941DRAFT_450788 [Chlamydoabsidia padenii]